MLNTSLPPKSRALTGLFFGASDGASPRLSARAKPPAVRASFDKAPAPAPKHVTLRVDFAPDTAERFIESVGEVAGELNKLKNKPARIAASVADEMFWNAAVQAGGTEGDKLEALAKAVKSRSFDSVLVGGLPVAEVELDGEIYDMRRAALLALSSHVGLTPLQEGGRRFDQMTTPVISAGHALKWSSLNEKMDLSILTAVPSETMPKTENAAEVTPPPVVLLAGTSLDAGENLRLVSIPDILKKLSQEEKAELYKPQFVFKGDDIPEPVSKAALPLAIPGAMKPKEYMAMLFHTREGRADGHWAVIYAAMDQFSHLRMDTRAGMVMGLTDKADQLLEKIRQAAITEGEQAQPIVLKEGEALFVNNRRMMHRAGEEDGKKYTVLLEKMRLAPPGRLEPLGR